jgi:hypothetical protein
VKKSDNKAAPGKSNSS